jgi:hypothetical protein
MIKRKQEWIEPLWLSSKKRWIDRTKLPRHPARRPFNQKPAAHSSFAQMLRAAQL